MDSPCSSCPLDSRPVSPEDIMECPDRVSSPAFVHSTPMQAGGLPQEALLQLELKKLKMEEKRLQYQEAEGQRQFQLGRNRLELEAMPRTPSHVVAREDTPESRLAGSLKLVPAFEENKMTEWFRRFEKKAHEFEWPRNRWVGLVANVLKGRVLEAYDWMSVDDLEDYEEFKSSILRVYELRPEAHRLQFRGARKRPTNTYGDCARYMEETLEKWLLSEDVDSFKSLRVDTYGALHQPG